MTDAIISRISPKIEQTTGSSTSNLTSRKIVTDELNKKITANSEITGNTSTKITYDSKGLVTSGASLELSDIPTSSTANRVLRVDTENSTPTYSQVELSTDVSGTLPVENGGTRSATAVNNIDSENAKEKIIIAFFNIIPILLGATSVYEFSKNIFQGLKRMST
jgi:hypothetical protein